MKFHNFGYFYIKCFRTLSFMNLKLGSLDKLFDILLATVVRKLLCKFISSLSSCN